jgi:hypothetical protein
LTTDKNSVTVINRGVNQLVGDDLVSKMKFW